jgi:sialate O-acetylesterase
VAYSLNGSNGNSIVHPPVNNSEAEFADLKNHPNIRLFRAGKQSTTTPMLEPHLNDPGGSTVAVQGWTPPTTADGIDRVDFSSMCYFFGRNIQAQLDIPIGLIGTYWGGTADELWSSPDALDKCLDPSLPQPPGDSNLWYGMASPFLRSTIKGSIWVRPQNTACVPTRSGNANLCPCAA